MVLSNFDEVKKERERKEEEEEKIRIREAERAAELNHLNKGAEWIQAHWKGLLTRKEKSLKKAIAKMKKKKKKLRKKLAKG